MHSELVRMIRRAVVAGCAAASLACTSGCERATSTYSAVDSFESSEAELDFFEMLEKSQSVTNNDALHTFLLLADTEDHWVTYEERVAEAKRRTWLSESFDEPANEGATVGWIARVACMLANVQGGLSMRIAGPIPRYAVRELAYAQVLVGKKESQGFTGLEFVDFLTRLDRMTHLAGAAALEQLPGKGSEPGSVATPLPPVGRFE